MEEARAAAKAAEEAKKAAEAEAARLAAVAAEEAKKGAEAAAIALQEAKLQQQTVEIVTVKQSRSSVTSSPVIIEEISSEPVVSNVLEPPMFVTSLSDSDIQEGKAPVCYIYTYLSYKVFGIPQYVKY